MIGERNIDSGKLPFRKEEGQQFPCEICLSAFLPSLTKKWLKMLAMTQELSIDLPLSNRVANQMEISDEKNQTKKQFLVCILNPYVPFPPFNLAGWGECGCMWALTIDRENLGMK